MVVTALGLGLLLLGARGFYLEGHFGPVDALHCVLLLLPAGMLLLLTSYVFQHARLVVPMPLLFAGLLVSAYPSFCVALGLVVAGAILGPAFTEWRAK